MDGVVVKDMICLVDGAMKNYLPEEWQDLTFEEKRAWCIAYGLEHARVIE